MDRRFMLMENFSPGRGGGGGGGCLPRQRGYIHVYFHNNETSSPLKPHGQSNPNFILNTWEGGKKVYINGQGHMTKMAAMAINRKNL